MLPDDRKFSWLFKFKHTHTQKKEKTKGMQAFRNINMHSRNVLYSVYKHELSINNLSFQINKISMNKDLENYISFKIKKSHILVYFYSECRGIPSFEFQGFRTNVVLNTLSRYLFMCK